MADLSRSNSEAPEPVDDAAIADENCESLPSIEPSEHQSSGSNPEAKEASVPGWDNGETEPRPKPKSRLRRLQWLSLAITLPFLGFNGLAAWQAYSLTHYGKARDNSRPILTQSPLQRLGSIFLGAKIARPETIHTPENIGLAFDSHRIDLGNGEFLEGWYVPIPPVEPEAPAEAAEDGEAAAAEESADEAQSSSPAPPGQADADTEAEAEVESDAPAQDKATEAAALDDALISDSAAVINVAKPPPDVERQGIVLLFPAYAASKETLLQEIKLLHRIGYATFSVDLRGVGDSSGSDTTLGRREAEDIAATVDYVRQTFDDSPIALYGRIMGASHVMRAIAEYDLQPDALIIEDPYAQLFSLTQAAVESVGLPRSPTTQMLTLWGGFMQQDEPEAFDPINYAAQITTPTLVLYGAEGSWVSLDDVIGVHSQLQGPKDILGLTSQRDLPVSATSVGAWMGKVRTFLDSNLSQ